MVNTIEHLTSCNIKIKQIMVSPRVVLVQAISSLLTSQDTLDAKLVKRGKEIRGVYMGLKASKWLYKGEGEGVLI